MLIKTDKEIMCPTFPHYYTTFKKLETLKTSTVIITINI